MNDTLNENLNDNLTLLAQNMESLRPAGSPPAWAEVIGPVEHPDQVRWHLDLETLVGFVAPPDCHAIAAVGHGWAHSLDDRSRDDGAGTTASFSDGATRGRWGSLTVSDPDVRRRVRVVCLMTRTGDMAGYLRAGPTILIAGPPTVGRVPDCLRRCFGLPTPPPEDPTDGLLAYLWLSNVVGAGEMADDPLSWPAVAQLHPAMQVAADAGLIVPLSELTGALRTAADAWTWSYLGQQATTPGWLADLLPAGAAGWMDEGILSRWLLGSFSGIDRLLDRVKPLVTPAAGKKLRLILGQLGVLPVRHPPRTSVSNT